MDFPDLLPKLVSVFALAFFSFWPAIIAGMALGLPPLLVIATTTASYACGAALVTLLGGRARDWVLKRLGRETTLDPDSIVGKVWKSFGVIGLGLAAPMTLGAQLGAAVAVALDAPPRQVFLWMTIGGLVWSMLLTALVSLGVLGAQAVTQ